MDLGPRCPLGGPDPTIQGIWSVGVWQQVPKALQLAMELCSLKALKVPIVCQSPMDTPQGHPSLEAKVIELVA